MSKVLRFILNEILHNGHLQSLGSLSLIVFSAVLFDIKITWDLLVISYLTFYSVLLYNRYKEMDIDYIDNKARTEHLKIFDKYIPYILFLTLFSLFILLFYFANLKFLIFMIAVVILGIAYTHYFKGLTKKIFLFKDYYVSVFFTSLLLFPFFYYSLPIRHVSAYIAALIVFAFIRDMRMQFILDLKDVESDGKEGLLTLGVVWGKERVLKLLKILSFVTVGLVPLIMVIFIDFNPAILMLSFLILFDFYVIKLIKENNFLGYVLEGGEFIGWAVLIIIGNAIL